MTISIRQAGPEQAGEIALMTGELLAEIMDAIGRPAFRFDLVDAQALLQAYLSGGVYHVYIATDDSSDSQAVGFVSAYESNAVYAGGAFGTIPEFYVRPEYRQRGIGKRLLDAVKVLGTQRRWKRLEVTTPPLPEFQAALSFYEKEGFAVSGGRKLQQGL